LQIQSEEQKIDYRLDVKYFTDEFIQSLPQNLMQCEMSWNPYDTMKNLGITIVCEG